jgi:hypothetical protein
MSLTHVLGQQSAALLRSKDTALRNRNILVAAGACLASITLIAPAAFADPAGPTKLAGTGSVTTENVMNAMAGAIPALGSWDGSTIPLGKIVTKNPISGSDCNIDRPSGSKAGVQALIDQRNAAATPTVRRPCLDFARSSDDNSANFAGSGLTWVPFAVDGVTIVTRNDTGLASTFPISFLKSLYECTLPAATQARFRPLLPQATSGTRSFFLKKINAVPNFAPSEGGTCNNAGAPTAKDPTNPSVDLVENDGTKLTDPRNVVPYSIAEYKAQSSGAVNDVSGNTKMRRVEDVIPDLGDRSFPMLRAVYNVIPTQNAVSGDPNYGPVFVGNGSSICTNKSIITGAGFGLLNPGDPLLPSGNIGCGDNTKVRSSGSGVVTGPPSP